MFTGIVEEIGRVESVRDLDGGRELVIGCSFAGETDIDESISVNGACMTVTKQSDQAFTIQAVAESLTKTNLGDLKTGSLVNLERSLTLGKALDGHIVQGHVDTTGVIKTVQTDGEDRLVEIQFDASHSPLIVGRGSVAVNGVSLTIAREADDRFTVAIIPYTWEHTTFHQLSEGDDVNLEFDIFGKYIVRYMDQRFRQQPE